MSAAQDSQPFHWRYPDLDDKNFELHGRSLLVFTLIFALVLLLALLVLYIRWALHRPGPAQTPTTNPSAPSGLDPGVISGLPVVLYKQQRGDGGAGEGADDQDSACCSICLSAFVEGEKVKMLPRCRHSFHPECVDRWLKTRSSCPMCRAEIQEGDDGGGV